LTQIQDGIYKYSSSGLSIMGCLPKRPSELLSIMTEQYEEPEVNMWGQERRGGRGKKKGKLFFQVRSPPHNPLLHCVKELPANEQTQAHLTWYGVEYHPNDNRDELENLLWQAMSTRPPPTLDPEVYVIDEEMRQRWIDATAVEQERYG
jgi:hypothetical protein